MTVKVECGCGQRYAFDVEPVEGRMPSAVACPACGADGTDAANALIAQNFATAAAAPPLKLQPETFTVSFENPLRIPEPYISFVCLDSASVELMEQDKAALGPLFPVCRSSTTAIVPGHVLFLYCTVQPDGSLPGLKMRIRDIVKAAHAYIAVVATENDMNHYFAGVKPENDWSANIVLVNNRNGACFATFFQKLFQAMRNGTSMMVAWNKLAPQIPNHPHPDVPGTIMLAGVSHVTFKA